MYRETILFIDPYGFRILGYLRLQNPDDVLKIVKTSSFFLYLHLNNSEKAVVEFVKEELPIKASRCFPCIFNLYFPNNTQLVMQSAQRNTVPFFPKVHLNHAFEEVYNPYSPVIFWYKVKNYQGIRGKTLNRFRGH